MSIVLYHGTPKKFNSFSFKHVGENGGTTGAGFGLYFSQSQTDALTYGNYLYTCQVELKNNVSNKKITIQKHILMSILNQLEKKFNMSLWENYGYLGKNLASKNKILSEFLSGVDTDTEIIGSLINGLAGGNCDEILSIFSDYGFNHTIDTESPDTKDITHYILYDLKSIKIMKIEKIF
jgi:hypothetical protein